MDILGKSVPGRECVECKERSVSGTLEDQPGGHRRKRGNSEFREGVGGGLSAVRKASS